MYYAVLRNKCFEGDLESRMIWWFFIKPLAVVFQKIKSFMVHIL